MILLIKTSPHPFFRRSGQNLELTLPVTVSEAGLGTVVDVPTPTGTVALTIPEGSSSGKKLRLKGQGIPSRNGDAGDLIVQLQIKVPEAMDDASKELLKQFGEQNPQSLRETLSF